MIWYDDESQGRYQLSGVVRIVVPARAGTALACGQRFEFLHLSPLLQGGRRVFRGRGSSLFVGLLLPSNDATDTRHAHTILGFVARWVPALRILFR